MTITTNDVQQLSTWFPTRAEFGRIVHQGSTWTPRLEGLTTAGTYTYSTQLGAYLQIGKSVLFSFQIVVSAITVAATGGMVIRGMPALGLPIIFGSVAWGYRNILTTTLTGTIFTNDLTAIVLYDGAAGVTPSQIIVGTNLTGSVMVHLT